MVGYGSYDVEKGSWSDDTALTLATMDSILEKHGVDYDDMMLKFCAFLNSSKYTSGGRVFGVEQATRDSLMKYFTKRGEAIKCGSDESDSNGALMRMVPIALYTYYADIAEDNLLDMIRKTSSLTHIHEFSILGCYIYVKYIHFILSGYDKKSGCVIVSEVDKMSSVNVGDNIVTSGLSDKFPRGIYIGKVEKIVNDKYDVSKTLYVKTKQDFNNIHYVTVLKEKNND